MRPYTEGQLDRYHILAFSGESEIRTQPWLCDRGILTCESSVLTARLHMLYKKV